MRPSGHQHPDPDGRAGIPDRRQTARAGDQGRLRQHARVSHARGGQAARRCRGDRRSRVGLAGSAEGLPHRLKPFYRGEQIELDDLPTPLYGLLQGKRNHQFRIVNTSRGCPYNCTFCSVKPFWGARSGFGPLTMWCATLPPFRRKCTSTETRTSGGGNRTARHRPVYGA